MQPGQVFAQTLQFVRHIGSFAGVALLDVGALGGGRGVLRELGREHAQLGVDLGQANPAAFAGLRQHRHGSGEELLGVAHQRDSAAGGRGKMGNDPTVGGDQGDADHQRQRQPHPLAEACVAPVENGPEASAGAAREDVIQQKRAEERACHGADGQRRDADFVHQQDAANDGAEAVDQRCDGLHAELLPDQQYRPKDSAGKEAQLGRQQDAGQMHAERGFLRVKSAKPPVDIPGRKDFGQPDGCAEHQAHGGHNHGERPLPLHLAPGFAVAGEDGDKGDGGRAADQKVGDHVGQHKCAVERVGRHAAAEEPDDVFDAHEADDAGEKRGGHQQDGG